MESENSDKLRVNYCHRVPTFEYKEMIIDCIPTIPCKYIIIILVTYEAEQKLTNTIVGTYCTSVSL